ncbi:DUF222 domain-containing protein [Mycobacterium sp. AMU20-3851]|uniref:HNH endonuclease signature motif containing protein n=1 Tax=Mycobacterium sp. AMU20-3851 TaxID=3122055 RepID=UPI003754FE57
MNAVLETMAEAVCPADPRTKDQRRTDAFFAVFAGKPLMCTCGRPNCPAEPLITNSAAPCAKLVVHLITDTARSTAIVPGYGHIDTDAVEQAAGNGTVREVAKPPDRAEERYRPSAKLAEFIRARDLTCRFPGCDVPAWDADIDHTVPYPVGPTHPSNLKCLCRAHHLLKTFHDWKDAQLAGGTIVWTSPTGHVYTTEPEGGHWFTGLGDPTGEPTLNPAGPVSPARCLKMPTRERPRHEDRIRRITTERAHNRQRLQQAEEHLAWLIANDEPAPF